MGTWGHGPFENDDALDWVNELADGGAELVADTLAVPDDPESLDLDAPDGQVILAAAEVVAAALGRPLAGTLPAEVTAFLATRPDLAHLRASALAAVPLVGAPGSELAELWGDSDDGTAWRQTLTDLQTRLGA